jgi:diguanylate cyclase (GGDEF)-like protein
MDANVVIILIAPEDQWVRELCDYLTARNLEVVWRADTLAGIEAAQQWPPNLVVVDEGAKVLRPGEIGKILKSKLPYTPVALLGSTATPLAMECLEAAGYDLLIRRDDNLSFVGAQIRALCRTHDVVENLVTANRRLVRQSVTDSMTGLYNHKKLLDWLEIEFKRAERNLEALSCIMADIDHFKQVNDTYGHKFGDFVLQEFSSLLKTNIRKTDILGRYGGEEFLIILPNTAAIGAVNLGEKLRATVEQYNIVQDGHQIRITASFGIASTSDGQVFNHDQLLQMTDKALYVAKQSGRNRVCSLTETAPGADFAVEPLPRAQRPVPAVPTAAILVDSRVPPHESLIRLIEASGLQTAWVADIQSLFKRSLHETTDVMILDPSISKSDRERVCERVRSRPDRSFPSLLVVVEQENDEATRLREMLGPAGEVVALDHLNEVLVPVLRGLCRLKALREEVHEGHARLRTLQKKLLRSERLKALGEIASGVAHDFNNALAIILGRSQMLRDQSADPNMRKGLVLIERAAQDVATSVKRILDFFRPESKGKFAAHFLDNLVQECLEVTKVRWKEEAHLRGIRYEITTQVPQGLRIWGNDSELAEVFNNLIFNALDAMPDGGNLEVRAEPEEQMIVVSFADTGVGMPPEVLDKIYDPFFTTKSEKGTGLGLSLVRGIILRHHGEIEVTSQLNQGTTFRIRLPIYRGEEDLKPPVAKVVVPSTTTADLEPSAPFRVLVVDDEPDILNLFTEILTSRGYEVVMAPSGAEALREIGAGEFQVAITDLGMPEMSGWDVIAAARKISPKTRYIIATGWGDSFVNVDLKARGVDFVLPKPVEVQSLLDLMEHIRTTSEAPAAKPVETAVHT